MATINTFVEQVADMPPAAAAVVVKQALGRPTLYFYGQLFHQPAVQAMKDKPATAALFEVLRLFTYGVYTNLGELSPEARELVTPNMIAKLRRLTLVTLAHSSRRLGYDALFKALDINDGRELEDLIIDTITEGLLSGRMDQRNRTVEVAYAVSRDVQLSDVPQLKNALLAWRDRCQSATQNLKQLAQTSVSRTQFEAAISRQIADEDARIGEECKKTLIEMDFKGDDDEWAAGGAAFGGGARGARAAGVRR
jgi:COP9 signalosome complex subunit 7